jgi:hypothetical protein
MIRPRMTIGHLMMLIATIAIGFGAFQCGREMERQLGPYRRTKPIIPSELAGSVWANRKSHHYHQPLCKYVAATEANNGAIMRIEHVPADFIPCPVCQPPPLKTARK